MMRVAMGLACVMMMLALDFLAAWVILSAAASFVHMEWMMVSTTPLGRALWLALFVWMARDSIPSALKVADRHAPKVAAS